MDDFFSFRIGSLEIRNHQHNARARTTNAELTHVSRRDLDLLCHLEPIDLQSVHGPHKGKIAIRTHDGMSSRLAVSFNNHNNRRRLYLFLPLQRLKKGKQPSFHNCSITRMHRRHRNFLVVELLGWFLLGHSVVEAKSGGSSLMDAAGNLRVNTVSDSTTLEGGVLTYITSPGTPSSLVDSSDGVVLSLLEAGPPATLMCPGATLSSSSESDCISLATSTLVANCIVVDGMTAGDIEAGLSESRHGITLSTLFGAKIAARGDDDDDNTDATKQTLVLPIRGADTVSEEAIVQQVESLFAAAAAAESSTKLSLGEFYDLKIVPYTDPQQVRTVVKSIHV